MKAHFTLGLAAMSSMVFLGAAVPGIALGSVMTNSTTTTAGDMLQSNSMSLNSTSGPVHISEQPMAIGHYNTTSENFANNSLQIAFAGDTKIMLPNSTQTITANTAGNVTIYFSPHGGFLVGGGNLTAQDGSTATISVTELFTSENAPGKGVAHFSTNSTGSLAQLNDKFAVVQDEDQPDGSTIVSFYEWQSGTNSTTNSTGTSSSQIPSGMTASKNNPDCVNPPGGPMI